MELKIIVIYCVCSDFLNQTNSQEVIYQMTDAEVVTFSIVSATINAVTGSGFEIKIFNFILAYTFKLLFKQGLALA